MATPYLLLYSRKDVITSSSSFSRKGMIQEKRLTSRAIPNQNPMEVDQKDDNHHPSNDQLTEESEGVEEEKHETIDLQPVNLSIILSSSFWKLIGHLFQTAKLCKEGVINSLHPLTSILCTFCKYQSFSL